VRARRNGDFWEKETLTEVRSQIADVNANFVRSILLLQSDHSLLHSYDSHSREPIWRHFRR
jgi:hypothetical protein